MEKSYNIYLWCGGYSLIPFAAAGTCEEDALNNLVAQLVKEDDTRFYLSVEDFEKEYTEEEYENGLTSYIYIDATIEGAPAPVYFQCENMIIEAA